MPRPQMTLRTLLGLTGWVAVWFATFSAGDIGTDVRKGVQLMILVAASASAFYHRQRQRAFWIGFVFVYLLVAWDKLNEFLQPIVPKIGWAKALAELFFGPAPTRGEQSFTHYYLVYDSTWFTSVLAISFLGGYLTLKIYDRATENVGQSSKSPAN